MTAIMYSEFYKDNLDMGFLQGFSTLSAETIIAPFSSAYVM